MTATKIEQMMRIEELIQTGHKNAISRKELVSLTGYTDRDIRAAIEASNRPIINIGEGYFIPDREDEDDLAMEALYVRAEQMRIESLLTKLERKFHTNWQPTVSQETPEEETEFAL